MSLNEYFVSCRCKKLYEAPKVKLVKRGKKKKDDPNNLKVQEFNIADDANEDHVVEYHRALIYKGLIMIAHRDALRYLKLILYA